MALMQIVPRTISAVELVKLVLTHSDKKHSENLTRMARADAPIAQFQSYVRNRIFSRPTIVDTADIATSMDDMIMAMNIIKMHYSLIVTREDANEAG